MISLRYGKIDKMRLTINRLKLSSPADIKKLQAAMMEKAKSD